MRSIMLAIVIILPVVLAAREAVPAVPLSRIFRPDMVGVRVVFLESLVGPARQTRELAGGLEFRLYQIQSCIVTVYTKSQSVIAYGLQITPRCDFRLGSFLNAFSDSETASSLRVGNTKLDEWSYEIKAQAECVESCSNQYDPTAEFVFKFPHVMDFLTFILIVPLSDGGDQWVTSMLRGRGQDYVIRRKFNCDSTYDDTALQAFQKSKPWTVVVGYKALADNFKQPCVPVLP